MAHWVLGGDLFAEYLTALDFADGTVVHICAETTGLTLVLFAGKRNESIFEDRLGCSYGCALFWVGWFKFNHKSGIAANSLAINAIVITQISFRNMLPLEYIDDRSIFVISVEKSIRIRKDEI
jgi:Amt family ammonium transporter